MITSVRRARLLVLVATVALVAAGCVTFAGNKEVTGGESDGPFVVRISCPGATPETEDLTFNGAGTETSGEFELDEGPTTCTITEIEQAGATSVTYVCGETTIGPLAAGLSEAEAGGGPGMSLSRRGDDGAECIEEPDGLRVEFFLTVPAEVAVSFTVINDFTSTPTTTAPPVPASEAAVATPTPAQVVTFTG